MVKFKANTTYISRFIGDADSTFEVRVTKVTPKSVSFKHPQHGDVTRAKIHYDDNEVAFFFPLGRYSMAPVVKANRVANPSFKTGKPKPGTAAATRKQRGIVEQDAGPSYTIKQTGKHRGVLKNPVEGRQYKKAVSLYRDFTGENPRHIDDWDVSVPSHAMEVGKVTGIMYKARVDGKVQEFLHEFTGRSRPILAASSDGRQLLLLGGDYKMTERGIVDGTYEFVR